MSVRSGKARKIRLITATVIAGAVLLTLLASVAVVLISHFRGDVPFAGGYGLVWIRTGSMEPTIPQRSFILLEKVDARDVAVGDVITFISDDPSIEGERNTHRVTAIVGEHEAFHTRGDNRDTNAAEDKYPAAADKLIGRYVKTLPFLSVMGRFLSSAVGIFAVCLIFLAIIMILYLPDMARIVKEADKAKKEKAKLMDELVKKEVERLKREGTQENDEER